MKLSRIEADWIASKLLSDAERERESIAQERTRWLVRLFPPLQDIRPTQRVSALREARSRAAREPAIMVSTVAAFVLWVVLYFAIPTHRPSWVYLIPGLTVTVSLLAQYLRALTLLRSD